MDAHSPSSGRASGKQTFNPHSLLNLTSREIARTPLLVEHGLDLGLPSRIIVMVFSAAIKSLVQSYHRGLRDSVVAMVVRWPLEQLVVVDLVGQEVGTAALTGTSGPLLTEWLMEALLTMRPEAKLRMLDLSGFTISNMFLVPLLWLPPEERTVEILLQEIHSKYGQFLTDEDTNIETVLNWKVSQLASSSLHGRFNGTGRVEIHLDCQANLSDWMSMGDEFLGLIVSERTPFAIKVNRLSVNNYQMRQAPSLRWLLSMIDKKHLVKLGIYGYRKSVAHSLYDFHKDFKQLANLSWFAWATCGPKMLRCYGDDGPTEEEVLIRSADVFHMWTNLSEAYFNGVLLTDTLAILLNALPNPLRVLYLCKTELSVKDLDYLAYSHHLDALKDLTIEKNNLQKMGSYVVELAQNATSLKFLSLKDTELFESDKIEILLALQNAVILKTFLFFDTHSMLSPEAYEMIVELACHIKTLRNFYIFPFNHEPFEKFHRQEVYQACMDIVIKNKRKDLSLAY